MRGLRGTRTFHLFHLVCKFPWTFAWLGFLWVLLCLVGVLLLLAFAFGEICFLSSFIPVVDRQCLALVRQCREKKMTNHSQPQIHSPHSRPCPDRLYSCQQRPSFQLVCASGWRKLIHRQMFHGCPQQHGRKECSKRSPAPLWVKAEDIKEVFDSHRGNERTFVQSNPILSRHQYTRRIVPGSEWAKECSTEGHCHPLCTQTHIGVAEPL